uniref:Uncharacterized protein n=1 Tax=Streptomyces sp. W75 TaxID=1170711 RepID=I0CEM6_9ACTN|nr:hypothetical protein pCQ4.114 [Streptomyces sp. W75]
MIAGQSVPIEPACSRRLDSVPPGRRKAFSAGLRRPHTLVWGRPRFMRRRLYLVTGRTATITVI